MVLALCGRRWTRHAPGSSQGARVLGGWSDSGAFHGPLDQANGRLLAGRLVAEDHLVLWVGEQHPLK